MQPLWGVASTCAGDLESQGTIPLLWGVKRLAATESVIAGGPVWRGAFAFVGLEWELLIRPPDSSRIRGRKTYSAEILLHSHCKVTDSD